jgi:hypothetical protein
MRVSFIKNIWSGQGCFVATLDAIASHAELNRDVSG